MGLSKDMITEIKRLFPDQTVEESLPRLIAMGISRHKALAGYAAKNRKAKPAKEPKAKPAKEPKAKPAKEPKAKKPSNEEKLYADPATRAASKRGKKEAKEAAQCPHGVVTNEACPTCTPREAGK